MKIVVFGASGGCGRHVVSQALERGHAVTAVTRPSSAWSPPDGTRHLVGDVLERRFVRSAVAGQDAVVSCLGLRRSSPAPWSPLRSPPDLVERFTRILRAEASSSSIDRVIWISAGGVGDSRSRLSGPVRLLTRTANVGVAYADLEAAEAITGADPTWLAVRPVTLVGGEPTGRAGPVQRYGLLSTVRRADVAAWMLDVAEDPPRWREGTVLLGTT